MILVILLLLLLVVLFFNKKVKKESFDLNIIRNDILSIAEKWAPIKGININSKIGYHFGPPSSGFGNVNVERMNFFMDLEKKFKLKFTDDITAGFDTFEDIQRYVVRFI